MSAPNEPLDLDAIEARERAATKGPWEVTGATIVWSPTAKATVAEASELRGDRYVAFHRLDLGSPDFHEVCGNATFIVHARTDVPAMAREIRRLSASSRWIPVGERLPEDDGLVLLAWWNVVLNSVCQTVAFLRLGTTWEGPTGRISSALAWRPLPAPPEVKP